MSLSRIADGRTDLVFDYLAAGNPAGSTDPNGVSLIQHCAGFNLPNYQTDVCILRKGVDVLAP